MRNDFESNYLMHKDRANHKYVAKIKLPSGKFYYFYNLSQYQNYMKGRNKTQNSQKNFLKDPNKKEPSASDAVKKQMFRDKAIQDLVAKKTPGNTVDEKTQYLRDVISKGQNKVASLFEGSKTEDTSKSSKKSGSGGSSKSSGKKSKGGSGSGSKGSSGSSKSGSSKGKSGSSKAAKSPKETTAKSKQKKEVDKTPINMDTIKKIYGAKDEDVTSFSGSASDFKSNMLKKYDEGSFGYLSAGDTTYKWEITGGQLILKDYDSGKEVSFDSYLKDAKSFKEIQTNKKKKK